MSILYAMHFYCASTFSRKKIKKIETYCSTKLDIGLLCCLFFLATRWWSKAAIQVPITTFNWTFIRDHCGLRFHRGVKNRRGQLFQGL